MGQAGHLQGSANLTEPSAVKLKSQPVADSRHMLRSRWVQGTRKNSGNHIAASHSRQPLVKGERLVRYEVNAVMLGIAACGDKTWKPQRNEVVRWPASPDARPLAERFVRRWMSRNLGCNREAQPQTVSAITFEFAMCLHGGLRGGCLVRPIRAALRALRPQEQIA